MTHQVLQIYHKSHPFFLPSKFYNLHNFFVYYSILQHKKSSLNNYCYLTRFLLPVLPTPSKLRFFYSPKLSRMEEELNNDWFRPDVVMRMLVGSKVLEDMRLC